MRELGARLTVLSVFLMIAVGCGSTAEKIKLGMTEQEVIAVLGEPIHRVPSLYGEENTFTYHDVDDEDMKIWFMNGTVSRVHIVPSPPEGFGRNR